MDFLMILVCVLMGIFVNLIRTALIIFLKSLFKWMRHKEDAVKV